MSRYLEMVDGPTHVKKLNATQLEELAAEIRSHVKARLVSHKVLRVVRFCGELPKTVTGKIQRFKLCESATQS